MWLEQLLRRRWPVCGEEVRGLDDGERTSERGWGLRGPGHEWGLLVFKTSSPCCISYLGFVMKFKEVQQKINGLPVARW